MKESLEENKKALGAAFGVVFGIILGAAIDNVGLGIALGIALGVALGSTLYKESSTTVKEKDFHTIQYSLDFFLLFK